MNDETTEHSESMLAAVLLSVYGIGIGFIVGWVVRSVVA